MSISWQSKALMTISEHLHSTHAYATGEEIKIWLHKTRKLHEPHHVSCYGPLIKRAIEENLLTPTDEYVENILPASRGRMSRIYTVTKALEK